MHFLCRKLKNANLPSKKFINVTQRGKKYKKNQRRKIWYRVRSESPMFYVWCNIFNWCWKFLNQFPWWYGHWCPSFIFIYTAASNKKQLNQLVYYYLETYDQMHWCLSTYIKCHHLSLSLSHHVGALIDAHFLNLYDL